MPHRPARAALIACVTTALAGCGDARLAARERVLAAELRELRAIRADPDMFRAEQERLVGELAKVESLLAGARKSVERSARALGFEVEERREVRPFTALLCFATDLQLRREGSAEATLSALDDLEVPHGAWIDSVRCTTAACVVGVSIARLDVRPRPATGAPAASPRPWWPEDRRRWDRVQEMERERAALVASLSDLAAVKELHVEHARAVRVLHGLEPEELRWGRVLEIAGAAVAAGVRAFDVQQGSARRGEVVLVAPEPPKGLVDALAEVGEFTQEGSRFTF